VVLPEDASQKDIYELELDLQMAKDTKAEYNWVDELLHIRYGIEALGEKEKTVAKKMRNTPQEIQHKRNMLHLVDLYLTWLGKKGGYHLVEGDEQVFIELEKYIKKTKNLDRQKDVRNKVFAILKNPPKEGRLYDHVRQLFKNYDTVRSIIDKKLKTNPTSENKQRERKINVKLTGQDKSMNPLGALAGKTSATKSNSATAFENPKDASENVESLIDAIKDAAAETKEKKNREATYDAVSDAQRKLQGVIIDSKTAKIESIVMKLKEIIEISNDMLKKIKKIGK
jgi:hypothetical protein